ncbi:MAG TPA: GNAT family N-acetyltransferase, partial [Candidatus Aquirickettsiella sp.]
FTVYAVELKSNREFIGFAGLLVVSFEAHFTPAVEIGWRLAFRHWGNGYATEAAKAIVDFAFSTLRLEKVVSFTVENNIRSRRVMERSVCIIIHKTILIIQSYQKTVLFVGMFYIDQLRNHCYDFCEKSRKLPTFSVNSTS